MGLSPEKFEKVLFLLEFVPKVFKQHQSIFKFTQKNNYSMVDIGTGPGQMLFRIENLLPKNYKEIICTDRSTEMMEYFNSIPKDPRITSRMLDISDDKMPSDLEGRFDFAFSSFCFAYALDLRKTFRNCSYLLKKGGETFFTWSTQSHVYEVYRSLSKIDKWAPYTSDFKNWKSLSENDDPIGILQSYIEDAGLKTGKIVEYEDFAFEDPEDFMLASYKMVLQPEKFAKVYLHLETIINLFRENQKLLKFTQKKFSMIDIGTGPGALLLKMESILPKHYKEIIGADKSEEMIEYFNSTPKDPRITCKLLDIQDEKMTDDMKGRFDFLFSSYCFQYLPDLTKAFRICENLLKPEGETFIAWSTRSHVHEVYRSLYKIEKWKPYTSEYKNWKSLIEYDDTTGTVQKYIEEAGLKARKIVEYNDVAYEASENVLFDILESQDKILHRIPQVDRQKYKEDFKKISLSEQLLSVETSEGKMTKIPFETIVAITEKY